MNTPDYTAIEWGFTGTQGSFVEYTTPEGSIYRHNELMSERNADLVGNGVLDLINKGERPKLDRYWHHTRNIYGSPSWSQADEVGLMDEEERMHRGF
jgi:hypothetical protein